jgi:hypothetical protein
MGILLIVKSEGSLRITQETPSSEVRQIFKKQTKRPQTIEERVYNSQYPNKNTKSLLFLSKPPQEKQLRPTPSKLHPGAW